MPRAFELGLQVRIKKKRKMPARAELISSLALLAPAAFAATRARAPLAVAHATAMLVSAALSIAYWSTADRDALYCDRVAARVRVAVDLVALAVALARDPRGSLLPMLLAILALAVYTAKSRLKAAKGDKRTVSILHATFHVIGAIGEIALVSVAYAAR